MCRLLGMVTREPAPLTETLDGLLAPFTALAREHGDGCGVAARASGGQLTVMRDVAAAHASAAFDYTLRTVTDSAVLHLRKASPGIPVAPGNTHPFTSGSLAFAHNGYFTPTTAVDPLLGTEALARTRGETDSERYFLLVLERLRAADPVDALTAAAADIRSSAQRYTSLNCLLLTEDALYAYADTAPFSATGEPVDPEQYPLRYRVDADRVLVASSGIPQPTPTWQTLPQGHVLEIRRTDLRVSTHAVRSLTLQAAG